MRPYLPRTKYSACFDKKKHIMSQQIFVNIYSLGDKILMEILS